MGFQDRDYMRSRGDHRPSSESVEQSLSHFLERHPRFFTYVGVLVGALVVVAVAMLTFMPHH